MLAVIRIVRYHLGNYVARTGKRRLGRLHTFFVVNIFCCNVERIAALLRLSIHNCRQRFQSPILGNRRTGSPLWTIRTIDILKLRQGNGGIYLAP